MRTRTTMFALSALLAVAGCSDDPAGPDGSVNVVVVGSSFARPAEIRGVIRNDSDEVLNTSTCAVVTDHRQGDAWVPVARLDLIACPAVLEAIQPGAQASFTAVVDASMPAGTWRVRFRAYPGPGADEPFDIISRSFTVR